MERTTAGRSRPGQKNDAGRGVIVRSHAVANATRLDMPDMYAMIRETYQV